MSVGVAGQRSVAGQGIAAEAAMVLLTLTVVAEGHLGLAEANRVLSRRDTIELLKLGLVNAL